MIILSMFQWLKEVNQSKKNLLQACSGILLKPSFTKQQFSIFQFIFFSWILITIGLMIAIRKKRDTENYIKEQGPKNLDSFLLNSILASLAICSFGFVYHLKG